MTGQFNDHAIVQALAYQYHKPLETYLAKLSGTLVG